MNIEGLRAIVNKDEIVPTRQARDFLAGAQEIDDLYKHHVRTYIPLQSGSDEESGVSAFAARFIRQVKEARAPRGYITADFGYGKTSAGLFVWQKAQNARLVAVPPFKLNRLEDLLDATAGWVSYILGKTVPNLVEKAIEIHKVFHDRELHSIVKRYGVTLEQAERMYNDRALQLSITPQDIVRFFEQMTDLVLEAGMEGLVVIPDELQQYLDPEIKSGRTDPLVPLFDIITELMNQQGKLSFGFLMIITSKELGVINDQRGDLIDRLRGNTLDLRAIYDRDFPGRLWKRFAEAFDYSAVSDQLVSQLTLESLGQIASRADLSNGPRTVINAFRRIATRALDSGESTSPYSPIDLIDDFLANRIAFDARKLLQEVTNKALATSFIRGNSQLEQAVKLLAAFPVDGADREVQRQLGLLEACTELRLSGSPEIVIEIGDRHHPALMLRALDAAQDNTDELSLILREFVRNYEMQAAHQMQRAVNSFVSLLSFVFRTEQWSTASLELRNQLRAAEAVFVGSFPEMAKRFPERTVLVNILGDDEATNIDANFEAECRLVFVLHRYFGLRRNERSSFPGELQTDPGTFTATFSLNLMLPCFDNLGRGTQDQLRRVVDVEDVNVMMVLALHAFLVDAAERDTVSKTLKEMIKRSMSLRLLEGALEVLLNPAVGSAYGVNGALIIEKTLGDLIYARYGDQYETLITYKQWRDNLRSYISVIRQLSSFAQKQGFVMVEGTKEDIAKRFSTTAATFDAFQARFPDLLRIEGGAFPSRRESRKSGVFLTRHSLEEIILSSLEDAPMKRARDGGSVRALRLDEVNGGAAAMGYRPDEIKFILEIMEARDLIEVVGGWIQEKSHPSVSVEELREKVMKLKQNAELLHVVVDGPDTEQTVEQARKYLRKLDEILNHHKETEILIFDESVSDSLNVLQGMFDREAENLRERTKKLDVETLRDDWSSKLGTMIRASAFTSSLNQVRLHYEQMLHTWDNEVSLFREHLKEVSSELGSVEFVSLPRFKERIKRLAEIHDSLNERRRILAKAVQDTTKWQETVNRLHELLEAIQRQGETAKDLLAQLQQIEVAISSDFEAQPYETFSAAKRYEQGIDQLEKQVKGLASQAERKFNSEQDQYRTLFIEKVGVKQEALWQKIIYSSNNPDGVYANLLQSVIAQASDLLDRVAEQIEISQTSLLALKSVTGLLDGESRGRESQIGQLETQTSQANDEYTRVASTVETDTRDLDHFEKWIDRVSGLQKRVSKINEEILRLRKPVQSTNLSAKEQRFLGVLHEQNSGSNLIRIRQRCSDLGEEEFWAIFQSVWEKQLIEIRVQPQ